MGKTVIITENTKKRLFEAMHEGFSLDVMRNLRSFSARVAYCKKYLGSPVGNGSSRVVFQIDDETVLKLAKNQKGVGQNESEYRKGNDYYSRDWFPRVYNGSDGNNFMWIVSEYVIPAKADDFRKVIGVPFRDVQEFTMALSKSHGRYADNRSYNIVRNMYDKYEQNDDAIDVFNTLHMMMADYEMEIGDFTRITNWGLTLRDGKETLLPLDAGFTADVFNKYYKRW